MHRGSFRKAIMNSYTVKVTTHTHTCTQTQTHTCTHIHTQRERERESAHKVYNNMETYATDYVRDPTNINSFTQNNKERLELHIHTLLAYYCCYCYT